MDKPKLEHGRTCVYNVNYHIVWSVKYRRKVLNDRVAFHLKSILNELATANGFDLAMAAVGNTDHIHVFVSAHPKIAPCDIVKTLKGGSAYRLLDFSLTYEKCCVEGAYGIPVIILRQLAQFLKTP